LGLLYGTGSALAMLMMGIVTPYLHQEYWSCRLIGEGLRLING
jgi:hypothetical protein